MSASASIPGDLARFATKFEFTSNGLLYTIERYDNHGRRHEGEAWSVACWHTQGDLPNVHYLGSDGVFRYKSGVLFATLPEAWAAYCAAEKPA